MRCPSLRSYSFCNSTGKRYTPTVRELGAFCTSTAYKRCTRYCKVEVRYQGRPYCLRPGCDNPFCHIKFEAFSVVNEPLSIPKRGHAMKNVLLVGNEFTPEAVLCRTLSRAGFGVTTKAGNDAMLFLLEAGAPIDLVILDHGTDENDCTLLRSARHLAPHVPVIVMTSRGSITEYLESLSLGVYEYIHKPVADREFMRIVQAATGISRSGPLAA